MEYIDNLEPPAALHGVISRMSSHMKVLAIVQIITGALYCLSIIGAVLGIPILIAGLRLKESADNFSLYLNNRGRTESLFAALERQARFFKIQLIVLIVAIVILMLYVLIVFIVLGLGVAGLWGSGDSFV